MTTNHTPPTQTTHDDETVLEEQLGQYGRDLHELRRHTRVIARYLGDIGVPRGETRLTLASLVNAGINDAYDDLARGH